jgi:hypothetical protein
MVLNNSSGFPSSLSAAEALLECLFESSSIFAGPREKNATSEPDMKAEHISRRTSTPSSMITGVVMAMV